MPTKLAQFPQHRQSISAKNKPYRLKCNQGNFQCGARCVPVQYKSKSSGKMAYTNCRKNATGMAKTGLEWLEYVDSRKQRVEGKFKGKFTTDSQGKIVSKPGAKLDPIAAQPLPSYESFLANVLKQSKSGGYALDLFSSDGNKEYSFPKEFVVEGKTYTLSQGKRHTKGRHLSTHYEVWLNGPGLNKRVATGGLDKGSALKALRLLYEQQYGVKPPSRLKQSLLDAQMLNDKPTFDQAKTEKKGVPTFKTQDEKFDWLSRSLTTKTTPEEHKVWLSVYKSMTGEEGTAYRAFRASKEAEEQKQRRSKAAKKGVERKQARQKAEANRQSELQSTPEGRALLEAEKAFSKTVKGNFILDSEAFDKASKQKAKALADYEASKSTKTVEPPATPNPPTPGQQVIDYIEGRSKSKPKGLRMRDGFAVTTSRKDLGIDGPEYRAIVSFSQNWEDNKRMAQSIKDQGKTPIIAGSASGGYRSYYRQTLKGKEPQGIVETQKKAIADAQKAIKSSDDYFKQWEEMQSEYSDIKYAIKENEVARGLKVFASRRNNKTGEYEWATAIITGVPRVVARGKENVTYRFEDGLTGHDYYGRLRRADFDPKKYEVVQQKLLEYQKSRKKIVEDQDDGKRRLALMDGLIDDIGNTYHTRDSLEDKAIAFMFKVGSGNFSESADYIEQFMVGKAYTYQATQSRKASPERYQTIDKRLKDIANLFRQWDRDPASVPARVLELYNKNGLADFSEPRNTIVHHRRNLARMRRLSLLYRG